MFEFITKMISPIKGIQMLKKGIENSLGRPVNHFQIIYIDKQGELFFKVFLPDGKSILDAYKGNNKDIIIFTVRNLAKTKLKDNEQLDVVTCEYNPDETLNLEICLTINNEKIKHTLNNYKP